MASQPIYQFYAELRDYRPKIWRRFQVPNNITVARLGYIVMSLFEMQACHLFHIEDPAAINLRQFMKDRGLDEKAIENLLIENGQDLFSPEIRRYGIIDEDTFKYGAAADNEILDATAHRIKDVIAAPKNILEFVYDYGDDWHVCLTLESIIIDKALPGKELPRVLDGAGYGIIEDCGGVRGLEQIASEFKKKKGPRYREYSEWYGADLDLPKFDHDDANFRLKKIPRIYADIYEYQLEPTKQSIAFLERRYKRT